jgi:cytoskeletal protein RodZ
MQLNEILEENSVKSISQKTNISESNLDALIAGEFDKLKRVKTMGFISILEREFSADLSALKKQAVEYYESNREEEKVTIGLPLPEEKKGKSIWFRLFILGLTVYTVWYFFTQFDKTQLTKYLPFSEEEISKMVSEDVKEELSIESINKQRTETDSVSELEIPIVLDSEINASQ